MKILAIETSCDETAIALIEAEGGLKNQQFKILKNLVASQIKIHRPFGGIVPTLAKREHLKNLPTLLKKLSPKPYTLDPNLIAVTVGPGLEPALWTGINFAKQIHAELRGQQRKTTQKKKLELLGVSHLEGHLYSFLLNQKKTVNPKSEARNTKHFEFPAVSLLVSGGHTILLLMKDLTHYKKIGETRDDAVGECFDKAARLLGLPYPGGPEIEKLALSVPPFESPQGDPELVEGSKGWRDAINFPRPMINQKNYDFSFSGLKTSILYYLRDHKIKKIADIAASFQQAAFDVLIHKTLRAAEEYKAKSIMLSGGVASNKTLQKEFKSKVKSQLSNVKFFIPPKNFCTDNAAMIAAAGYINYLRNKKRKLVAQGNLSL